MKLSLSCPECQKAQYRAGNSPSSVVEVNVDIEDEGLYRITCEQSHNTLVSVQNPKFEILFEIAAFAVLDGYYREAVTGFATTIERLHEHCLQILCVANQVPLNEAEKAWKYIAKQSERQLGAFVFSFLISTKTNINNIYDKKMGSCNLALSAFRNKVVHQGYIPTHAETIEFGSIVLQYSRELLVLLRKPFSESFPRASIQSQFRMRSTSHGGVLIGTILNSAMAASSIGASSFEDELNRLRVLAGVGAHSMKKN
jgi:hypothetical protein